VKPPHTIPAAIVGIAARVALLALDGTAVPAQTLETVIHGGWLKANPLPPTSPAGANGAPSNIPAFAAAFSCKADDPMVRAEVCRIW